VFVFSPFVVSFGMSKRKVAFRHMARTTACKRYCFWTALLSGVSRADTPAPRLRQIRSPGTGGLLLLRRKPRPFRHMAQRMTYMLAAAGGAVTASYVWLPSLERAKELQPRVDARQKRLDDLQAARSKGALTANEYTAQHQRLYPIASLQNAPPPRFPLVQAKRVASAYSASLTCERPAVSAKRPSERRDALRLSAETRSVSALATHFAWPRGNEGLGHFEDSQSAPLKICP